MNLRLPASFPALPLLVALSAAGARAQAPQAVALPLVPIHTAEPDRGVPYGTWAAGDGYKASFHDGMTFVPYLGADYPHNQPWSWRTVSVRLGETELLPSGNAPVHRPGDLRYEYDFGSVIEAYDVRADGLEQTFVLARLPATGDLVITGAVTSALAAAPAIAAHQTLSFTDGAGQRILDYGRAWAVDAHGDRLPITTAHAGGVITLTVPQQWLRRAALPVTVDPLLAPLGVMASQPAIKSVDPGRDEEAATWKNLFAVVVAASQFDDDVRVSIRPDAASGVQVFSDITTNWDSDEACCAFVGGADRWVIVFRRYFANDPIRVSLLRCHVHASDSSVSSTSVTGLTNVTGINDWRPDVGGVMSHQVGNRALVVFQREDNGSPGHWGNTTESAAYGSLIDAVTGAFGTEFPIWDVTPIDVERPSINQVSEGGTSHSWVIAVQTYDRSILSGTEWNVRARRCNHIGTLAQYGWSTQISSLGLWHQLAPVVEGTAGRYAIAFAVTDPATFPAATAVARGHEIQVQRVDWPHTSPWPTTSQAPVVVASDAAAIFEVSGMAHDIGDRSHWTIGYRTVATTVPSAFGVRIGYRGHVTEGPVTLHAVAGEPNSPVRCAFDATQGTFAFIYGVTQNPTSWVWLHRFPYVTPTPWTVDGTGCASSQLSWFGNQQIGAEFNEARVSGAPSSTIHVLLVSLASLDVPVVHPLVYPGCSLLIDAVGPGYLGTMAIAIGSQAAWPLALPEALAPMTIYFQDWQLDSQAMLSSTQRLAVPLVR